MPPIPVHTSSPINANHPSNPFGTSPGTAAARYTPVNAEASPTTTQPHNSYPAARPGAPAVPQPTNAASATYNSGFQPTTTIPNTTPTATANSSTNSPPPPQPGAVPSPYTNNNNNPPTLSIPQPPRPGANPQYTPSPTTTAPVRHSLPAPTPTRTHHAPLAAHLQSPSVYEPNRGVPPASLTSTYPHDLSHPPGYVQDSRASFDDKPIEECQPYENRASPSPTSRRGILDGEPVFDNRGDDDSNILNTAMSWAKAAGKRLSRTEQEIWKHINGDGKH